MKVRRFIKDIFFNPFDHYRVDKILTEECTYIDKNHARDEIEKEFIKSRISIGKVFGLSTFSSYVSSSATQKKLSDFGYEENFSMEFKKLPKYLCEGSFIGIKENCLKVMSTKFY